jgi:hypothetical protein
MKKGLMLLFIIASTMNSFAQWQNNPAQDSPDNDNAPQSNRANRPPDYNNGNRYKNTNSALTVVTTSGKQFTLIVDNNTYESNRTNGFNTSIDISSLSSGSHNITLYETKKNIFGKKIHTEIYSETIYLKQGYKTTLSVDVFGNANIHEQKIYNNNNDWNNNDDEDDNWWKKRKKSKKRKHRHCDHDDDDDY